jgi:hypothetical protein
MAILFGIKNENRFIRMEIKLTSRFNNEKKKMTNVRMEET